MSLFCPALPAAALNREPAASAALMASSRAWENPQPHQLLLVTLAPIIVAYWMAPMAPAVVP